MLSHLLHNQCLPACNSEQAAVVVLGYTQVSWDNLSGQEPQPWSWDKFWNELSVNEKAAIVLLGYDEKTWDNDSGMETQPDKKSWAELSECG